MRKHSLGNLWFSRGSRVLNISSHRVRQRGVGTTTLVCWSSLWSCKDSDGGGNFSKGRAWMLAGTQTALEHRSQAMKRNIQSGSTLRTFNVFHVVFLLPVNKWVEKFKCKAGGRLVSFPRPAGQSGQPAGATHPQASCIVCIADRMNHQAWQEHQASRPCKTKSRRCQFAGPEPSGNHRLNIYHEYTPNDQQKMHNNSKC